MKSEVEGNRAQFPNSFDDNGFGDDSESMRAKTYVPETESDYISNLRQQALADVDLRTVVESWQHLSDATRRKITNTVKKEIRGRS